MANAYSTALDLLDGYDHQTIAKPKARGRSVALSYEECRRFVDSMKFAADSPLFGNEKDGSFKSALGAVYQSFGGKDLYPSSQEEAAKIAVREAKEFLTQRRRGAEEMEVVFCCFSEKDKNVYENLMSSQVR